MSHQFKKLISERVNILSKKLFCIILQLKLFSRKLTLLIETSVKFPSLMQMQLGRRILFIILICLWIDYADSCCINLDNWNIPQQFNWNNFACFFCFMMKRKTKLWRHMYPVFNFQCMKSPVELNSLFSKFFCYITWFVVSPD